MNAKIMNIIFVLKRHRKYWKYSLNKFRVIPEVTPKLVNNTNVHVQIHSKFTLISLFSKIHSLKSEHIHSFLFREYTEITEIHKRYTLFCKHKQIEKKYKKVYLYSSQIHQIVL